ncbi:MAG: hypothetical protein KJ864_07505 [Candidatus Omnitrophica bacterium]|nr:hypothetical protein [Candidatus Omnitrophota bacterium]
MKRLKFLVGKRRKRSSRGLAPWLKNKKRRTIARIFESGKKKRTYEATDIAQVYESQRWQWIRVKQWFNDHKDDYTMK